MASKRFTSSNVRNNHHNGDKNLVEELNQQIQELRNTICNQAVTINKLQDGLQGRGSNDSNNGNNNAGELVRMKAELQEKENKVVQLKKEKEAAETKIAEMKEEAEATIAGQKTRIEDLEEQLRQAKGTPSPSYDLRLAENQKSVTFMNLSESPAFDPSEKRQSDLDDINKILDRIGLRVQVANTTRFSPNFLASGRPPFLKVRLETEEDKHKVFNGVRAHIKRIRSLGPKFAEVAIGDPAKAKPADNNSESRSPTDVANGTLSSAAVTSYLASRSLSSNAITKNFASRSSTLNSLSQAAVTNNSVSRSPPVVTNKFGSPSRPFDPHSSSALADSLSDSCSSSVLAGSSSPPLDSRSSSALANKLGIHSRVQQMFASPVKPEKHARLYTDGPGIYTSDEEF